MAIDRSTTALALEPDSSPPALMAGLAFDPDDGIQIPSRPVPIRTAIRRAVSKFYAAFIHGLDLLPEEATELMEMLACHQSQIIEHARENAAGTAANVRFRKQLKGRLDDKIKSLLGRSRFDEFESYRICLLLRE